MNAMVILVILWVMRLSLFFPLIVSAIKANTKENKGKLPLPIRIMILHILLAFLLQMGINVLDFLHINYAFLIHIYVVEEFILDMLFYQSIIKKIHHNVDEPKKRPMFLVAIVAFVVFAVINALFITDIYHFPVYTFVIQSIIMVICAGWYYHRRTFYDTECVSSYEAPAYRLYKGPVFWMNMGKLIYFVFAFPLFILYHIAVESGQKDMSMLIWSIQNISLITLHVLMGIGFLVFTGDPKKVMDVQGRYEKKHNNLNRKLYKQKDLSYMDLFKNYPDFFERFKNLNPDLIPASYTFEEYKKDFNALLRSQYIAQTPEMLAFLKERPSALEDFKKENPDLFNEADKT